MGLGKGELGCVCVFFLIFFLFYFIFYCVWNEKCVFLFIFFIIYIFNSIPDIEIRGYFLFSY